MTPTLPGDIPGLLRRCSPVLSPTGSVGVVSLDPGAYAAYYLDLSDATGRAHAAWWLVATLWPEQLNRHEWVWSRWSGTDGHWQLGPPGAIPQRFSGCKSSVYRYHGFVPTLSDLNYLDPRLLPDGSRWVDAEAMRRVVLHVAGRPL